MAEEGLEDAPWAKQQSSDLPDAPWATAAPEPLNWSQIPGRALQSAPHSAWEMAKNIAAPIADVGEYGARGIDWAAQQLGAKPRAPQPTPTLTGMSEIGQGVMQKLGMMKGEEHVGKADAVGKFLMDRYGSVEGIKKTMAEDPVGLAADISTVLSGGAMLAGRVPGVGGVLSKAARVTDPLTLVGKATSPILSLGSEALGLTTGAGGEAVKIAGRAGLEGGEAAKAFRENMRDIAPREQVVADAQTAIDNLRAKRGREYVAAMNEAKAGHPQLGQKILQFDNIDKAIADSGVFKKFHPYGTTGPGRDISPETAAIRERMTGIIDEWRNLPPTYHTLEGIDAMKQELWEVMKNTQPNTPASAAAGKIYNAVRQTIVDADPKYAKIMEGYEEASTELRNLEREFSIPWAKRPAGNVNTALRKLQSALRDNVSTAYGNRKELAQYLADNGSPQLLNKLAGQSLHSIAPRGLARLSTGLIGEVGAILLGMGAASPHGLAAGAAGLALASPRLVGESAYGAGKIVGGARPLMKPSYLTGRLVTDPAGFKKGGRVTKTFRYGGKVLRRQGGGPTSTGEPPGGMFQQPAAPPAEPPPWESGLTNGAAPVGVNLPQGMYYGTDPGWMSGGGPGTGEPDRPSGRAAFSAPGVPTDEFAAANQGLLRSDLASPLDYTSEQYTPRGTGGFYSIDELYSRTQPPVALPLGGTQPARPPDIFAGQGGMSTNNWRLLGRGPGWIMRNGQLINTGTLQAKQGLPFGADPSFSDTAESGMANYQRRVNPGGALTGRNKYDAYYWPGAEPWGYTRWPYQTDV